MTAKHIITIHLSEIKMLEIVCSKCGGGVNIPLPAEDLAEYGACPGCKKPFWSNTEDAIYRHLVALLGSLSRWDLIEQTAGFKVKFSVEQLD